MFDEMLVSMLMKQIALIYLEQNNKFHNSSKLTGCISNLFNLLVTIEKMSEMGLSNVTSETIEIMIKRTEFNESFKEM